MAAADGFERVTAALARASRVAALTGAGVSAESGLPTFRGKGGLWEGHRVEEVATPEAFERDPTLVWSFYEARRRAVAAARPNGAHRALARLEPRYRQFLLATQNVDGLHRRAGSRRLVELHGSLARIRCTRCAAVAETLGAIEVLPPRCACGGLQRPDVIWFGELLPAGALEAAAEAAAHADVYLVVGTSAEVYPAAGLALLAAERGAEVFEINPEATALSPVCAGVLRASAGAVLTGVVEELARRLPNR